MNSRSSARVSRPAPPRVVLVLEGAGLAGTERHVRGLLEGLSARGWPAHLVTSRDGPLRDRAQELGIPAFIVPRVTSSRYVLSLARVLRSWRPGLVHTHSGRLAALAARLAGVPALVETRHGIPERLRPLYARFPVGRRWEGCKCRLAHRTLTVCAADTDWLVREGGLPRARIRTLPNGIPLPAPAVSPEAVTARVRARLRRAWGWGEDDRILGFVGRLSPQKAPERVLEVLAGLVSGERPGPPVRAVFCGTGPLLGSLQERTARLGLEERVRWLGELDPEGGCFPGIDLLLLPSAWEGLPYVLLEALRAACMVLCTPVGGIPEVLRGSVLEAGCRTWSAGDWVEQSRRMLAQAGLRPSWAAAARERLRSFPESLTVAGVLAVYEELLGLDREEGTAG